MADLKDDIKKYLSGKMSAAEMHVLEKKALSDPFLADALEGAESISPSEFDADVTELEKRIAASKKKNTWFWPMRIAASFLVITTIALLVYNTFPINPAENIAEQKTEPATPENSGPSEVGEKKPEENLLSLNQPEQEPKGAERKDIAKLEETPQLEQQANEEASAARYGQGALPTDEIQEEAIKPAMESLREEKVTTDLVDSKKEIALEQDEFSKAKSSSPAPSSYRLQRRAEGRVTSADDGSALAGVNVIVKGSSIGTVTDAAGNYSLPLPADTAKLEFSALDKKSRDVSPGNNQRLNVILTEDEQQLNEVVVTGYELSRAKKDREESISKLAEPIIGRVALKKYMEKNVRYPDEARQRKIEGKVVIEFVVRPDGSLTDFKVLKGIGYGCDEEVIRLIKDGSAWSPTLRDNLPVTEKARVQFRFKLP
jgi:TonB family protein